jgi:hypothetical protein
LPTWRHFNQAAYQCGLYEAQDILAETDAVEVIAFDQGRMLRLREMAQRLALYRDPTNTVMFMNPGLREIRLTQDYELLVVVCQTFNDLLYVNALKKWKERCRASVCWIDELWAASVPRYKNWLKALEQFDHVCVSFLGTVEALSRAIGRVCHWIPGGVDAVRFSPYPNLPTRVVDVYSIGRRWEGIHEALLRRASANSIFYIHDTLEGLSSARPYDIRQHREMYANVAKRSRYYVVAPAKMNLPSDTGGQIEVGYRYFEAAASGAILLGQAPPTESYRRLFDWPDAVVEIHPDGSDVLDVIDQLNSDPERTEQMCRRTAAESLLRHDWLYRWQDIYRIAGVAPSTGMLARERRLQALASIALKPA